MSITENYNNILESVKKCEDRFGRDDEVTLVAVSKTKPLELLMEAYNAGCRDFGENYVQELVDKIPQMPADVRWHMIGHLQKNKVKYIVGKVFLIHSVDSLSLAEMISKESVKNNVISDILLEVNVANEESKWGTDLQAGMDLALAASELPNIRIKGLMTVAPYTENSETNRGIFRQLKQLSVDIMKENKDNISMDILSMGMSGDYEVAIAEGATHVRVGTSIFGARDYSK